jgi:methionyl aminopeptidase
MTITLKTAADIEGMRMAGRLASEVLDMLTPHVVPGVTTRSSTSWRTTTWCTCRAASRPRWATSRRATRPTRRRCCTSINHVVCHGIPNDRPLKNGDIVNIDVTVIKDGWHGDTSRMFIVGEGSIAAKRLCQLTYEAMWKGIVKVRPGARLGDIGHAIQTFAEGTGFSVVREFCGHGIGRASTRSRRCCTTAARARWRNWCPA